MAKPHRVDEWGVGARVAELWALGRRGTSITGEIMPEVEAWAKRTGKQVPVKSAVIMAVTRYMKGNPVDQRTKQAKAVGAVPAVAEQAAVEMVRSQLDAFEQIQKLAERLNDEIDQLQQLREPHPKDPTLFIVPSVATYAGALSAYSRELRGWTSLFVELRDRLAQHQQYEEAFQTILGAVCRVTTAEQQAEIAGLLRADPLVWQALRGMGGGER